MKTVSEWAKHLQISPATIYKAMAKRGIRGQPRLMDGRKKTCLSEARMIALFPRRFMAGGEENNLRNLLAKVDELDDQVELMRALLEKLTREVTKLIVAVENST